jgi:dipeptide/tripeptide permease
MAAAPSPSESDTKPEPFLQAITSFSSVYWIANWMELVERFAYYGVRVVLPVFMVEAISAGGPEFDHVQKGTVYAIWALVQSFVPIFTGGFADQYGYKLSIAISTVLKIVGYMLMGFCIQISDWITGIPLAEARVAGTDWAYEAFFAGAMFLAAGTAIFKPGLQGLIANQMPRRNAALGWGLFYQMVNIGGFIGPLLAGYLRILEWEYVFLACSIGIALNFIPLFFFKEPDHHGENESRSIARVLWDAVCGLLEPRLFFFTIAFAGFWLMFYQLFDILPNFIDDWVDSRGAADFLKGLFGDGAVPVGEAANAGNLTQEWIINFNALLISIFAFALGYITGKVRSLTAIIVGIGISAVAIYMLGMSMDGWWTLFAVGIFSLGEMSASPTKMRYLASIAPAGKEGLYMGYVNFTVGIGWSIGSIVAGELYQKNGDKVELARRYMVENEVMTADAAAAIDRGEVLNVFTQSVEGNPDPWQTRQILWDNYDPEGMWLLFTVIGLASMVLIFLYDRLTKAADRNPDHSFNTKGQLWVRASLVPIILAFLYAWLIGDADSLAIKVQVVMFSLLFVASFLHTPEIHIPYNPDPQPEEDSPLA